VNQKQFQRFIDRDGGCVHCGRTDTLVPHHRANRGMGGSKDRDVPSNIVTMCAEFNGLMESKSNPAQLALMKGWKCRTWDKPIDVPVFNVIHGVWFLLDDEFNVKEVQV
jgi:hypothetical protein